MKPVAWMVIVRAGLVAICGALAAPAAADQAAGMETNTNRPGRDYKTLELQAADPAACQSACQGDAMCEAWTYVRPGLQGPAARCWLKSAVPAPAVSDCCISGLKTAAPPAPRTPAAAAPVASMKLVMAGEFLKYRVEIPTPATYSLWVRDDDGDWLESRGVRRLVVDWDGRPYGTFAAADKETPGDRDVFGWHRLGSGIYLTTGTHTMTVTRETTTAGAATLDAFYLTAGPDSSPPGID